MGIHRACLCIGRVEKVTPPEQDHPENSRPILRIPPLAAHQLASARLFCVRRAKARIFSGCDSRPATGSLQPVAIGAVAEVTKPPEPSMQRVAQATPRAGR